METSLASVLDTRAGFPILAFQSKASIGPRVKAPVLLVAGAFLLRCLLLSDVDGKEQRSSSLIGVISGVTGLLVATRSSSSSDRWHEGRRLWANVAGTSRTLLRTLALALPPPGQDQQDSTQQRIANDTLALIPAFAYCLKDHLRNQTAAKDANVKALLTPAFYAHLSSSASNRRTPTLPAQEAPRDLPVQDAKREQAVLNVASPAALDARSKPGRHFSTNAPLAIIGQLHSQLNAFHTTQVPSINDPSSGSEALDTPTWANCLGLLANLTDQVTHMERIKDTPIPMSLAIHMQQLIGLYVLAVPLQLVSALGIWVIPVSALAAWVYYGIDGISQELSDPFGTGALGSTALYCAQLRTEPNDLPLDKFCADIRREYREVIGEEEAASLAGLDDSLGTAERLKRE